MFRLASRHLPNFYSRASEASMQRELTVSASVGPGGLKGVEILGRGKRIRTVPTKLAMSFEKREWQKRCVNAGVLSMFAEGMPAHDSASCSRNVNIFARSTVRCAKKQNHCKEQWFGHVCQEHGRF